MYDYEAGKPCPIDAEFLEKTRDYVGG
jgi:hypothetical protein